LLLALSTWTSLGDGWSFWTALKVRGAMISPYRWRESIPTN
jgi:hypothetical protein